MIDIDMVAEGVQGAVIRSEDAQDVFLFLPGLPVEAPYVLHALPYETIFDFLLWWHNTPLLTDLVTMDYFLTGNDLPQTNRLNSQASGEP